VNTAASPPAVNVRRCGEVTAGLFLPVRVLSRLFRLLFRRPEAGFPGIRAQAFLN
jgi:hypothetical protein